MKRVKLIIVVLMVSTLSGCGGSSDDNPPVNPPVRSQFTADVSAALLNFSTYPMNYTISCVENCAAFQSGMNASGSVNLTEGILNAGTSEQPTTLPFDKEYAGLNYKTQYTLRFNYDNHHGCQATVNKSFTGDPNAYPGATIDFSGGCGEEATDVNAQLNGSPLSSDFPANTDIKINITPTTQLANQVLVAKPVTIELNASNKMHQQAILPNNITYQVATDKLLNSADYLASYPTEYTPKVAGDDSIVVNYLPAAERFILPQVMTSQFNAASLVQAMTTGGYNVAQFSGISIQKDQFGGSNFVTKDNTLVDNLIGILGSQPIPAYEMAVLELSDASNVDPDSLKNALESMSTGVGIALDAKDAADHIVNLQQLIKIIEDANINQIVIKIPANATPADIAAMASLHNSFDSKKWTGWIEGTATQLTALNASHQFSASHLVVDMSTVSPQPTTWAQLAPMYPVASYNGLIFDDQHFSASDIANLRHTLFVAPAS